MAPRAGGRWGRRSFLGTVGLGAAVAGVSLSAPVRGAAKGKKGSDLVPAPVGGDDEPYPIPWLDKNGSHNEAAGPGHEPSSIYHFKGQVARAADFAGGGVDGKGERLLFGTPTTDNAYMQGECWTSQRRARTGTWAHL